MAAVKLLCPLVLVMVGCCWGLQDISRYRGYIRGIHNLLRAREGAADMKYMNYDLGLERRAAAWVNRCVFRHQLIPGIGENLSLVASAGATMSDIYTISSSLSGWYNERRWYRGTGQIGSAGHYTQMVWSRTSRVGCALNYCPMLSDGTGRIYRNAKYFACFYSPMGNWVGQPAFVRGPPCSRCPRGNGCVGGLCVGPEPGK